MTDSDTPTPASEIARVREDMCPKCPGELDTGFECNKCGFDAWPLVYWIELQDTGATLQ